MLFVVIVGIGFVVGIVLFVNEWGKMGMEVLKILVVFGVLVEEL